MISLYMCLLRILKRENIQNGEKVIFKQLIFNNFLEVKKGEFFVLKFIEFYIRKRKIKYIFRCIDVKCQYIKVLREIK